MKEVGEGAVRDGDREMRRKIRRGGSQEEDREEAGDGQEDVDMDGAEDTQNGKKKQRKERKPKKEGKKRWVSFCPLFHVCAFWEWRAKLTFVITYVALGRKRARRWRTRMRKSNRRL